MIDTSTFLPKQSRWQDIFTHLKSSGFEVYSPGIKVGECLSKYIVVKNDGASALTGFSTDVTLYSVMCYVPKDKYSTLDAFVQEVKEKMKELEPMILPYGVETPAFYDDSIKAHMISVEYKNYKKWNNRL